MQGVWYTDPCKHKIFFVRFCAVLHVSPALHRTSAGAFACPYPKSVLCCKGGQRMERNLLVLYPYLLTTGQPPPAGNGWRGLCVYKTRSAQRGAPFVVCMLKSMNRRKGTENLESCIDHFFLDQTVNDFTVLCYNHRIR